MTVHSGIKNKKGLNRFDSYLNLLQICNVSVEISIAGRVPENIIICRLTKSVQFSLASSMPYSKKKKHNYLIFLMFHCRFMSVKILICFREMIFLGSHNHLFPPNY